VHVGTRREAPALQQNINCFCCHLAHVPSAREGCTVISLHTHLQVCCIHISTQRSQQQRLQRPLPEGQTIGRCCQPSLQHSIVALVQRTLQRASAHSMRITRQESSARRRGRIATRHLTPLPYC
jgi:hypothetical protein